MKPDLIYQSAENEAAAINNRKRYYKYMAN